jgi:hypothetical protein
VRVGRAAIDEDAIRLIEEHNPQIEFDWTRILKQTLPTEAERPPRTDQRREPPTERSRRGAPRQARQPHEHVRDSADAPSDRLTTPPTDTTSAAPMPDAMGEVPEPPTSEPFPGERPTAAFQRLGSEGLARLRARYAEVLARIAEHQTDEAGRDQLRTTAERLNPDAWVTPEDVTDGLEHYEVVFEQLRGVVGSRRRRRRRR